MSTKDEEITQDADLELENSDDEEEEDLEDEGEESEDEPDGSEDDDKPVTRKELKEFLKSKQNAANAARRVASKKDGLKPKAPKDDERLNRLEQSIAKTELLERKRQYGYENSLDPKEVDLVFRFTKRPTVKTLNDPFVKGGLENLRAHKNVKNNTPGSSARQFVVQDKKWNELDARDKQANFTDRRRAALEARKK